MSNIGLKITNNMKHISEPLATESSKTPKEKAKLAKAAKDFESMLTSMMLKSMTKTSGGMFGEESFGGDYFDTIFETEMATHISKSKSLGVAEMIYKNVIGEDLDMNKIKQEVADENKSEIKIEISNDTTAISPSKNSTRRASSQVA